jgi:hypothetical protein
VVKWPGHVNHVDVLLETYPDARIVVCHRDPVAMLSSVSSLVANLRWAHADSVDFQEIAREQADVFADQCDRLLRWRTNATVDPARVVDVRFDELVADQAGVVARVYDQLEIPMPTEARQRVADLLAAKPRGRHGGHEHTFADLGLDLTEQRARFAAYQEHFGIRSE